MKKIILAFSVLATASALIAFAQEITPQPTTVPATAQPSTEQTEPMSPKPMPSNGGELENGGDNGDFDEFVDPQQIRDALRQIKDLKREISRVLKSAKKTTGMEAEISQLNDLMNRMTPFEKILRADNVSRDTMSEFWDGHFWDEFNVLRLKIELPEEIKRMEKDMKRLDKSLSKVKYTLDGLDMNAVRSSAAASRAIIAQVKIALGEGSYEDAQETMQNLWGGEVAQPGEIMGVVEQTQNIARELRSIKAAPVKQEILDFLAPIITAANSGDFREANTMLNEINRDIFRIMSQVKRKSSLDMQMKAKMEQLEQKMMQKIQEEEQKHKSGQEPTSSLMPYQTYRSASLLTNMYDRIMELFGN